MMKKFTIISILLLMSQILLSQQLNLTVKIEGIKNIKGNLLIGIYNNGSNFPDKKFALSGKIQPIGDKTENIIFENLKPDTYAVAIIHDENKDGKLSTNFIGIPKEAFGFSNNVMGTFGPPSFDKAAVDLKQNRTITIKLRN